MKVKQKEFLFLYINRINYDKMRLIISEIFNKFTLSHDNLKIF